MKARYQYRFYPTDLQKIALAQLFGCTRVVWNDALAICQGAEKLPSSAELQRLVITAAKQCVERQWLGDVSAVPLQQSVADLATAYKNYFDSLKGKRKGKRVGRPRFKKKQGRQSARFNTNAFSIKGKSVYLAKIGDVNPIWSRELPSTPSSVTVIKDAANRYFLSFVVEVVPVMVPAISPAIGIDLGIKTFAVLSPGGRVGTGMHPCKGGLQGNASGQVRRADASVRRLCPPCNTPPEPAHERVVSPSYAKLDKRIRRKQKKLARQVKGSKRREKTRLQIAKLHNRIADTRRDFLHKLSTRVVNENQVIALEDLNVSGMLKNRKLSRAISQQGWSEFRTLVDGKAKVQTREFVVISRWQPTSQVCADCGFKWGKLDLSIRMLRCLSCGTEQDRDANAARNILKVGIGHGHDSKRTGSDHQTTTVASCVEPLRITAPSGR